MAKFTYKNIKDIGYYQGPHEIKGIQFHHAAKDLGVTAWGMNVLELEPNVDGYPEHDHVKDGQEEVYIILKGRVTFKTDDDYRELHRGDMVRVGPEQKRKFSTTSESATILAIGGTPGAAYKPKS